MRKSKSTAVSIRQASCENSSICIVVDFGGFGLVACKTDRPMAEWLVTPEITSIISK